MPYLPAGSCEVLRWLCVLTGVRQDPCVLDVFISLTRFVAGEPAQVWWAYTEKRKQRYGVL